MLPNLIKSTSVSAFVGTLISTNFTYHNHLHSIPQSQLQSITIKTEASIINSPTCSNSYTRMEFVENSDSKINMIEIVQPDDWHHHFRDGDVLPQTVDYASKRFARVIAMPNLKPPVTTTDEALAYRERILSTLPQGTEFQPLMTLYMTDRTTPEEIRKAKETGVIHAVKLYPAGATTNSDSGVTDIKLVYPALEAMAEVGMVLCVHGEVTDQDVDIFDREPTYITEVLEDLVAQFPTLKIVMEHITTEEAVQFVMRSPPNVAATITCHHLLFNRNAILAGGIRPHMYCLPVLKREKHRQALLQAAVSAEENGKFFLGTDSAPHEIAAKESECGCAGIFTGHAAVELYTEAFDSVGALSKLEAFASFNGPDFYGLPRNTRKITLVRRPWQVPKTLEFGSTSGLYPLRSGTQVEWSIEGLEYV
mmetsp:Transcript_12937/g.17025  ORF Transcript_12937/g.17025 Transcript_12937/m.17025 type:complete len:422 (-) Transcript_12937:189-1454(-)